MTLPTVFLRAALTASLFLTACGERADTAAVDTFAAEVEARAGVPFAREGAVVTLDVPATVAAGATVPIRLRVRNTTSAPLDLYLRGREITFEITIVDSSGDAVWRRLDGKIVPAILQIRTLAPGETLELSDRWDQKSADGSQVVPGRYLVRGEVVTDGESSLVAPAVPLEVTASASARGSPR